MITATYHNMLNIVNKLFGGLGSKNLKTYDKIVKKINDFETEISKLDDQELKNKTQYFKNQFDEKQKTIDNHKRQNIFFLTFLSNLKIYCR